MVRRLGGLLLVVASVGGTGCAAAPAPTFRTAPLEVPRVPKGAARARLPSPEASTAPEGLRAVLRVADVTRVASTIDAALGMPALSASDLLSTFLGRDLSEAVDETQPIDGVTLGDGDSARAASFGLRADGEARLRASFDERDEDGLVLLVPKPGHTTIHEQLSSCALVSRRLVCATNAATLHATATWLVGTVRDERFDSDLRVTVPGDVIREHRAAPSEDDEPLVKDLLGGIEREIDRVDVDLTLGAEIEASIAVRLLSRETALTRALTPTGPNGPPPDAFFRLPDDAAIALFHHGASPGDLAPLKRALRTDLEGSLEADGYEPSATKATLDELAALLLTGGPFVLAAGVAGGKEAAQKVVAPSVVEHDPKSPSTVRAALAPWIVVGLEEPPSRWIEGIRRVVRKSDLAERTRTKPSTSAKRHDPDGDHLAVRIATMPPATKLPKDALHVELRFTPRKKGARPTRVAHLYVVPQGGRTWIGYGEDDAGIRARLEAAIDGARTDNTLAQSPLSAALKNERALGAGTATVAGLILLFAPSRTIDDVPIAKARANKVLALPAGGASPIVAQTTVDPSPDHPVFVLRARAAPAAIASLVRAAF